MNTVVEQPKPIELDKHTPVDVERPIKYIEKVNIPIVDGKATPLSALNTNINADSNANLNALEDLSAGYEPHKIKKKA